MALMKSVIMYSAPLKMMSASALAFSSHCGVGPAVTSTVTPALFPKASAASRIAGSGPPGPYARMTSCACPVLMAPSTKATPTINRRSVFIGFSS